MPVLENRREGRPIYGKYFASTFTGSMFGAGLHVFALWGYVIANSTKTGAVEINPKMLSSVLGCAEADILKAVSVLTAPDPSSRSKKEAGARLIKEGEYLFKIVNHGLYKDIRNEDERREYFRVKQAEHRALKSKHVKRSVKDMSTLSTHIDVDVDVDIRKIKPLAQKAARDGHNEFLSFYSAYPRKKSKGQAEKAFKRVIEKLQVPIQTILDGLERSKADWINREPDKIPHPATWLNAKGWEDESDPKCNSTDSFKNERF
mgnify:FL=1